MMDISSVANFAVKKAGEIAMSFFHKDHTYHGKGEDANFATEADLASERVIFEVVQKNFPGHNFLSEEMGLVDNKGEYTWVVDPIDGTFNFSHGQPLWGVECGIFKGDTPFIGVLHFPVFNELYFAQKGQGAFLNGKKISVSANDKLSTALIALSLAYPAQRKRQKMPYEHLMRQEDFMISQSLSTAYDLAAIAGGRVEGFLEEITCIWDIAGGTVLIEEAGGRVTDWEGKPIVWDLKNKDKFYKLVASNAKLYPKLFKEFRKMLGK